MFQFPGFASLAGYHAFSMVGCPIRTSTDQFLFADPRSFSQLITSFFASESLGIPHTLLFTSFKIITVTYSVSHLRGKLINRSIYSLLFHQHVNELLCQCHSLLKADSTANQNAPSQALTTWQ